MCIRDSILVMNLDKILGKNIEGFYLKKDSDFNIISIIIKIETVLLEVFVNEDTDTLKPVSYTHLDVYKRQPLLQSLILLKKEVWRKQFTDWV